MDDSSTPEPQGTDTDGQPHGAPAPADSGQATPPPQGDTTDWKAQARKWERQAKDARTQLQAVQAAIGEKDAETVAANTAKAQAELAALRYRIAYEAGLPPRLAERLAGDDEEAIRADAAALAALVTPTKPPAPHPGEGAGQPPAPNATRDPNDLLRLMAGK